MTYSNSLQTFSNTTTCHLTLSRCYYYNPPGHFFVESHFFSFLSQQMVANEVLKRLPPVEVQVPVSMASQRQVVARFSRNDNITTVVAAFANFFEIDDAVKIAIMKRARYGMAPGTFLV